jgi:hypothetical protein
MDTCHGIRAFEMFGCFLYGIVAVVTWFPCGVAIAVVSWWLLVYMELVQID